MPNINDSLANSLLDEVLNGVDYTPPTDIYVGLFDGDPFDGGVEVDAASYARQIITFNSAATQEVVSASDIQFPEAEEDWGAITHTALVDAETGGTTLFAGELSNSRTVYTGDIVRILAGEITVSI